MGQLRIADEEEIDILTTKAAWCDIYKNMLDKCQEKLYPDYISIDPVSSYQYAEEILMEMYFEIKQKRKSWWRKLF